MMPNRKIAVTGGIGSGKSTLCSLLREMGFPVFSCDDVSRRLWEEASYREALAERFPACTREGKIDKALIASLVFSDRDAMAALNAFSHPRIMEELLRLAEGEKIAFCEVPLLFEGGYETLFDGVIALVRDEGKRIEAVCARDGASPQEVKERIKAQFPPEALCKKNCFILENNGGKEELREKLLSVLDRLGL